MRGATVVARTEGEKKSGRRMGGEREGKGRSRHDRHSGDESKRLSRFPVVHLKCYPGTHTHATSKEKKKEILLDYTHTKRDSIQLRRLIFCLSSSLGQQQQNNNFLSPISWIQLFNCDKSRRSIVLRQSSCFVSDSKSFFFPTTKKDQNHTKTIDRIQQSVEFGEEC